MQPEGDTGFGQLTLTIGKYYRVTGESTQHRGVSPDIELPSAIDADRVGERVRDSALPWDTVSTTRFSKGEPLDTTIESLSVSHSERSSQDPNFVWLKEGIRVVEEARARDSVSLNIDKRRSEREDELARRLERENERRAALNVEPVESLEDVGDDDIPDVLLDQAAGIVTDMAELREVSVAPARTAQVTP